jgi:hypothetical protein
MKRFVEENIRTQTFLLPESIDEYVSADNPTRVIEAFVEELDWFLPRASTIVFGTNSSVISLHATILCHAIGHSYAATIPCHSRNPLLKLVPIQVCPVRSAKTRRKTSHDHRIPALSITA